MQLYTVTLTASQLDDIRTLTGEPIPARKVAQKRVQAVTGGSQVLPPSDYMAAPFGTVSDRLHAYMTEHATPGFVTSYMPTKPYVARIVKTPLPKSFFTVERDWNAECERAWKQAA